MKIVKTFNEWKAWIEKYGYTPRYHSKVDKERSLAYRMQNCIIYIRKHPGEYEYILQEYEKIQAEYNHGYVCKQDTSVTFNLWKAWVYEHEKTPRKISEDSYERMLATKIGYCIYVMLKKQKEHEKELKEYYNLLSLYSLKKDASQRISEWESWVLEHERLPRRSGKDLPVEERRMAENIYRIYKMMLNKPEKYEALIAEYERIHNAYYEPRPREVSVETFFKWKAWVLENEVMPSKHADDEEEVLLSKKITYAVKLMKRNPTEYHEALEEYHEMCERFSGRRIIKNQKQRFKAYKEWVVNHGRFPKNGGKSIEEKRLSEAMYKLFRTMRADPEEFAEELEELEVLDKKYKHPQNRETLKKFNECKQWIVEHEKFPKYSSDRVEKNLRNKLRRCLAIMKQAPDVYGPELEEYQELLNVYGQKAIDMKNFNLWKELTLKNGVVPSSSSETSSERELAARVKSLMQKYKKNPEKYENILQEYEFLCEEYSRKKLEIKNNLLIFEEWEKWCLVNERMPDDMSSDEEEVLLYIKMKSCLHAMRKAPRLYEEVLRKYKNVRAMYKKKK